MLDPFGAGLHRFRAAPKPDDGVRAVDSWPDKILLSAWGEKRTGRKLRATSRFDVKLPVQIANPEGIGWRLSAWSAHARRTENLEEKGGRLLHMASAPIMLAWGATRLRSKRHG